MKNALISLLILTASWAQAQESFTFNPGVAIPDQDNAGVAVVAAAPWTVTSIGAMTVEINISPTGFGGFNGDLYLQLTHTGGGGTAVLLNRPGRTSTDSAGFGDSGFSAFTFDDAAAINAHDYPTGGFFGPAVSGTFAPDARLVDPLTVEGDNDAPSAANSLLGAFGGLDPTTGNFVLLAVDGVNGVVLGPMTLDSFTITLTQAAGSVPEPGTLALYLTFLGVLPVVRRWRMKNQVEN